MTWKPTPLTALAVLLFATVSGCNGPQFHQRASLSLSPLVDGLPTSQVGPGTQSVPDVKQTIVMAAHTEPTPLGNTSIAAQPLLPRTTTPEMKPGSEPPAAPNSLPPIRGNPASTGGPWRCGDCTSVLRFREIFLVAKSNQQHARRLHTSHTM